MPLQNRVIPTSEITSSNARGHYMGNRGILHNDSKELGIARWKHKAWIICVLDFKKRQRRVMTPNRYTELFFYDEATALAAGHRPCAECQRKRFNDYQRYWKQAFAEQAKAGEMDHILHSKRVVSHSRQQVTINLPFQDIPNGCFLMYMGQPHLKWGSQLHPWTWEGYENSIDIHSNGKLEMLTPVPSANVLHAGYQPDIIGL
ncbi:hypothetical protein [Curvivirga aplysinae]|uniref:hypothetical protein n=1 Tax=Curvivirga aplysinae TaxID=2529852 RepID=UPI0012BCFEC4|nr:hypothetical protein [Curvivirga aplysinae]MTI09199.1 hypothetical protein [Curvivirga aplysinae]